MYAQLKSFEKSKLVARELCTEPSKLTRFVDSHMFTLKKRTACQCCQTVNRNLYTALFLVLLVSWKISCFAMERW